MRSWLRRNRGFLVLLVGFGLFRTAVADWNPIPSGSMRPTLLEGDVVWVNRLAYDLKVPLTNVSLATTGQPQRGDVVTFSSPIDGTRLIKRLVALPGDTVELRDEVLLINGQAAEYVNPSHVKEAIGYGLVVDATRATEVLAGSSRTVQVLANLGTKRSFGPVVVPSDHYFMLGDNRDNSLDSRYIGFVSRELLIGRAERILVSADIIGNWLPRIERTAAKLR
ncbi:MAG TPA: signal peptidase I [Burkholderiaceae bacterium]|nr:signal peptidase I [Burkholderiaceae bacterium]